MIKLYFFILNEKTYKSKMKKYKDYNIYKSEAQQMRQTCEHLFVPYCQMKYYVEFKIYDITKLTIKAVRSELRINDHTELL